MRFTINSLAICLARARIANPRQRGAAAIATTGVVVASVKAAPFVAAGSLKALEATKTAGFKAAYNTMNFTEKVSGVISSNPELTSIAAGAIYSASSKVLDLPPIQLDVSPTFTYGETVTTLLLGSVEMAIEFVTESNQGISQKNTSQYPTNIAPDEIRSFTHAAVSTQFVNSALEHKRIITE